MRRVLFLTVLCSLFVSSLGFSKIIGVSIPAEQKMNVLPAGSDFQFDYAVVDDQLGNLKLPVEWTLTDLDGFETNVPGMIDEGGKLHIFFTYDGVFKVKVTEPKSQLFDEAYVEVKRETRGAWFVDIHPQNMFAMPGGSIQLGVRCYDKNGYVMPRCTLRYTLFDQWGRRANQNIYITNQGVLYVSYGAIRGHYSLEFQAVDGPGRAMVSLDIY